LFYFSRGALGALFLFVLLKMRYLAFVLQIQ